MNSESKPKRTRVKSISGQTTSTWLHPNHFMRMLVTVAILCSALYIVLWHKDESEAQKWAFGAIGTILGFWLKT